LKLFFEQKKENKWQHIIFDFRGNTRGESAIVKEITERMSGEQVRYTDKEKLVNTPAAHKKTSEVYGLQDQYNTSATEG